MATQAFPVKLAGAGLPFGKGSSLPAEPEISRIASTCSSVRPLCLPMRMWEFNWLSVPFMEARAAMVASSRVFQSRLSRPKMSPKRWAFRNSSMAGANWKSSPLTGAPQSFVWFSVPKSILLPAGGAPASAPSLSLMPRAARSLDSSIRELKAFRLRGKPQ